MATSNDNKLEDDDDILDYDDDDDGYQQWWAWMAKPSTPLTVTSLNCGCHIVINIIIMLILIVLLISLVFHDHLNQALHHHHHHHHHCHHHHHYLKRAHGAAHHAQVCVTCFQFEVLLLQHLHDDDYHHNYLVNLIFSLIFLMRFYLNCIHQIVLLGLQPILGLLQLPHHFLIISR